MKKLFYVVVILVLATGSVVFAEMAKETAPIVAETTATTTEKNITLKGYVIDNACASGNKENLAEFTKSHPKTCLLKGPCAASGYSLFSDGKLEKFSQDSMAQISDFLKKEDSTTAVEVTAQDNNGELKLVSIKNQ